MIRPKPHLLVCQKCGYTTYHHPQSDALSPLDFSRKCPKCGGKMVYKNLETSNVVKGVFNNIKNLFK